MLSKVATQSTPFLARGFRASPVARDKIVAVLYPDPLTGYPPKYCRDDIPKIETCVPRALSFEIP